MLEAWTETKAGRRMGPVTNAPPHRRQCARVRFVALDVGEQGHVVACFSAGVDTAEVTLQIARESVVPADLAGVQRIGIKGDTILAEDRFFRRQPVRLLIFLSEHS